MRALVFSRSEDVNEAFLNVVRERERDFIQLGISGDSFMGNATSRHPDYTGKSLKDPRFFQLIKSFLTDAQARRTEIAQAFNEKYAYLNGPVIFATCMQDGDVLAAHTDLKRTSPPNYQFNFIQYFFKLPRKFSGGQLKLYWPDGVEIIEPEINKVILFPSWLEHSVDALRIPDKHFENSRFALVGRFTAPFTPIQWVSWVSQKTISFLKRNR